MIILLIAVGILSVGLPYLKETFVWNMTFWAGQCEKDPDNTGPFAKTKLWMELSKLMITIQIALDIFWIVVASMVITKVMSWN